MDEARNTKGRNDVKGSREWIVQIVVDQLRILGMRASFFLDLLLDDKEEMVQVEIIVRRSAGTTSTVGFATDGLSLSNADKRMGHPHGLQGRGDLVP